MSICRYLSRTSISFEMSLECKNMDEDIHRRCHLSVDIEEKIKKKCSFGRIRLALLFIVDCCFLVYYGIFCGEFIKRVLFDLNADVSDTRIF